MKRIILMVLALLLCIGSSFAGGPGTGSSIRGIGSAVGQGDTQGYQPLSANLTTLATLDWSGLVLTMPTNLYGQDPTYWRVAGTILASLHLADAAGYGAVTLYGANGGQITVEDSDLELILTGATNTGMGAYARFRGSTRGAAQNTIAFGNPSGQFALMSATGDWTMPGNLSVGSLTVGTGFPLVEMTDCSSELSGICLGADNILKYYDTITASMLPLGTANGDITAVGSTASGAVTASNILTDIIAVSPWNLGSTNLTQRSVSLYEHTAEPTDEVVGQILKVTGYTGGWDPLDLHTLRAYDGAYFVQVLTAGNPGTYLLLFDITGQQYFSSIETPTHDASELNDTSSPHLLTVSELKNKILTNQGTSASKEYDFPARTEGWNVTYVIEAVQNVILDPNGTEQWYLNSVQLAAGENIQNTAPTIGEIIVCISTETAVYCESKYADWAQETP